jgi:hypothetical protein
MAWKIVKMVKCYGNLAVANNNLCADRIIIVSAQKNGKIKVEVYDGPNDKPFSVLRDFTSMDEVNSMIEEHEKNYPKVEKVI